MNDVEKGVTILEFTLAITIVLTFILAIFDLSVYFHAKSNLREVARRITKEAVVDNNFALDSRSFSTLSITPSPETLSKVSEARKKIVNNAVTSLNKSLVSRSFDQKYFKYEYASDGFKIPSNNNIELSAMILRPGEVTKYISGNKTEVVSHPNCVTGDPNAALCKQYMNKPGAEAWNFMQRNIPYYAEVKANVSTILFGNIELKAQSVAWKDIIQTSSKSDYAQVPTPLTCSESYPNPNQLCTSKCGSTSACDFYANNLVSQSCYSCKTCQNFTTADQVCASCGGAGGDDTHYCQFNPTGTNANTCGGCKVKTITCDTLTNADTVCAACGGEDGNSQQECVFNTNQNVAANANPAVCGGCKYKTSTCSVLTNADTVCAACGGANGNQTQECIFNGNQNIPVNAQPASCGGCSYRQCSTVYDVKPGVLDDTTASGIPECNCNYSEQSCVFNSSNNYNLGCFGCVAKKCSQKYTEAQIKDLCNQYEASHPGQECIFNANNTTNCISGRYKTCSERIDLGLINISQICSACDSNTQNCVQAPPGSRATSCASCQAKTCKEAGVTAEQLCGTCAYGTQCKYNPNSPYGSCGGCQACPAVTCRESDGLEIDSTGCGCKSCVPTDCPTTTHQIVGCKCVPLSPH